MKYAFFKKPVRQKLNVRQLGDLELYFDKVPPAATYKLHRLFKRRMRRMNRAYQ